MPAGTYHLLAAVADAAGTSLTPIAAEDATFRIGGKHAAVTHAVGHASATAFTRRIHAGADWR